MDYMVNWLPVLAGAVANMLLGWLWYSPMLFGRKWASLLGWSMDDQGAMESRKQGMGQIYALTLVASVIMSYVLNMLVSSLNIFTIGEAIQTAFVLWLGLVGMTSLSGALFEKRPAGLWAINAGYTLASFILVSLIAVLWPY